MKDFENSKEVGRGVALILLILICNTLWLYMY